MSMLSGSRGGGKTEMNRRSFFRLGAGLAGAAAVAPKVLLEPVAAPVMQWRHLTPNDLLMDVAFIYGICRAPGEDDASLKQRLITFTGIENPGF